MALGSGPIEALVGQRQSGEFWYVGPGRYTVSVLPVELGVGLDEELSFTIVGERFVAFADPGFLTAIGSRAGPVALGFIIGELGIGLGYPGQPHVVNRFMALRDERAVRQARVIAIAWAVLIYAGMLLLGLCGRVLFGELIEPERVLFEVADRLMTPVVAGIVVAALLFLYNISMTVLKASRPKSSLTRMMMSSTVL